MESNLAEPQRRRKLLQVTPKTGNAVMRTQRGDALPRPAIAMTGPQSVSIQDACDEIIFGRSAQSSKLLSRAEMPTRQWGALFCGQCLTGGVLVFSDPAAPNPCAA
jgi:hypothetical protein